MQTDVLIVGAGPTGLMLANQLARRAIKPMVIDRHSGPAQQTRAMAVHARTLEIYAKMGLADAALKLGARGTGANMWASGRWSARIPIGDIGHGVSPFPFVLTLGQDDNERLLGENLARLGVEISWQTELVSLVQKSTHVEAVIRRSDGSTTEVEATWVAGCDGARSAVREICGIAFPGEPYEHTFFVADTEAVGPMKPGELNVYLWRDGFHLFFPMRGQDRWRVIGILPEELRQKEGMSFDEVAPRIRAEAGAGITFKECSWFSTYRIHHRAAEHFRDGRCFLLGDAAHIHSPMGGQGMNTGLQDAYNLAWKLALVINGRAAPGLLDSYEQERLPVARQLLETTDRAFRMLVANNWLASLVRTRVIATVAARAMTIERVRQRAFKTLSQTGIAYPKSSLAQKLPGLPADAPKAGERFPWISLAFHPSSAAVDVYQALDDRRFNLLVFEPATLAPDALTGLEDVVTIRTVPSTSENRREMGRVHLAGSSFYLVRPDGHIGVCGPASELAAARSFLTDRIELSADAPAHDTRRLRA